MWPQAKAGLNSGLSGKAYLSGRRTLFPIPLKTRAFLVAIGGSISGHSDELPKAGWWPDYWARLNRNPKALMYNIFLPSKTLVATFYTYPEPTSSSEGMPMHSASSPSSNTVAGTTNGLAISRRGAKLGGATYLS